MTTTIIRRALAAALLPIAGQAFAADMSTEQAVEALKLAELAATYSAEKVERATGGASQSQADALLIDMGVLSAADLGDPATVSEKLGAFVADQQDVSESYIGNVSDRNIAERLVHSWEAATVIQNDEVLTFLNGLIDKGYTTGYNVVSTGDASNFDPDLMLRYGHSDIQHAVQLIYLMKSEGFDPKVQFIPKSSAFVFLPEWGEPGPSVVTFDSGKMVSVVKEYNLDLEFRNAERRDAFMDLITTYAKKDAQDEPGLIHASWWQPFYRSYVENDDYVRISENVVTIDGYQADLASLPENAATQAEQIRSAGSDFGVETIDVWVNPAFHRYLLGEAE